ncbi:MAG: hypothetical protein H0A75_00200 [Candidatus Methanofishera endochildressiae]|uniref:Uncharacterized protein n=1 Tax=Candidatus Methanofishera endochildressiae TaxID=2738884 RepID=A0A7Z0MMD3_9GAMM|nr:hypothetical protein [Candidatus Methanofishera endochildressiae]
MRKNGISLESMVIMRSIPTYAETYKNQMNLNFTNAGTKIEKIKPMKTLKLRLMRATITG